MADESFVENFVDFGAIVDGALRFADDLRALGGSESFRHFCTVIDEAQS